MSLPGPNVLGNSQTTTAEFQAAIENQRDYLASLSFSNLAGTATANQIPSLQSLNGACTAGQVPSLQNLNGQCTAGQVPNVDQLNNIAAVWLSANASLTTGTDGSLTLPNGFKLIWFRVQSTTDNDQTFTFPGNPFSTICCAAWVSGLAAHGTTFTRTSLTVNRLNEHQGSPYFTVIAFGV